MDSDGKLTYRKRSRGSILVLITLSIVVLIALTGLVVDLGYMYSVKGQLQNAADAAALAGAAKLTPTRPLLQNYSAHYSAQRFASLNNAAGEYVNVALNISNDTDGDIVVGCWTGGPDIITDSNCIEPNAVKVIVRRTDEPGDGVTKAAPKQIPIFLGKILGDRWRQMSAKASAIAYLKKANVAPMAVNEYWYQNKSGSNRPYGNSHAYPNSFVRTTNVDGSASPIFGKTFAIFGANAENNNSPANPNGFVALNYRSSYFDGSGNWYSINTGVSSTVSCGTCGSGFNGPMSPPTLNSSPIKDQALGYLTSKDGYPETFILPTAVREQPRSPLSSYPTSNLPVPPAVTSDCPYATVGYISGGGQNPTDSTDFAVGDKVVAAVYDGVVRNSGGGNPDVVTFVGYSLIQIDGYSTKNPKIWRNQISLKVPNNILSMVMHWTLSNLLLSRHLQVHVTIHCS